MNKVALLLFASGLVVAQTTITGISVDEPELYYGFFSLRTQMQTDISSAESDSIASERQASLAKYLHISEADFVRAGDVSKDVLARIAGVVSAAKAYNSQETAGRRMPDRVKLQAYQQQRTVVLEDGMKELKKALSPQGWSALHDFINGEYRSHLVRKEVSHANN